MTDFEHCWACEQSPLKSQQLHSASGWGLGRERIHVTACMSLYASECMHSCTVQLVYVQSGDLQVVIEHLSPQSQPCFCSVLWALSQMGNLAENCTRQIPREGRPSAEAVGGMRRHDPKMNLAYWTASICKWRS